MAQVIKNNRNRVVEKIFNRAKIYNLENLPETFNEKKIGIDLDSTLNILQLMEADERIESIYQKMIDSDYIFYLHYKKISYFTKRKYLKEIWEREDLFIENETIFTIEKPINDKDTNEIPRSLIVIFSSFPEREAYISSRVAKRMFQPYYTYIQNTLIENTYVVRIFDNNLTFGSYYMDTDNFINYEENIQMIISNVRSEFNIDYNRVICVGEGKGGTGAYYHAKLGDFHSVVVAPICNNLAKENYERDVELPAETKVDLESKLDVIREKTSKGKHYIIVNEYLGKRYMVNEEFGDTIINYPNQNICNISELSSKSEPIQSMLINELLFSDLK
ncbi:hypothetical protein RV11_GL002207 [Enterococcus phoeniculicola]|jgi:hypothetical protein|uniref:XcbB/CpsF family capsular polysaccharide biosynthesis protein n=1 Tax=Enterococcus phoeniculicola ATCC BAA-412 TaxID=1158610 RepID=R3WNI9_9ENTE|nr:XcbB/CpsF family capsular polysaccharide biosynthesis protein [Enterococcus phoeniculicola]EOL48972.1 hypothetical protein UC3_00525 [Enterococcus phoeniculicola ATCC BAA-412]EOT72818.1 hypothetical protein I589_03089 [Enterococcus phoeniculicola ATCC BAA-412]OJG69752.1 hypothetical protein RV11_GL002207 [Enterococcus phoeniculicola]